MNTRQPGPAKLVVLALLLAGCGNSQTPSLATGNSASSQSCPVSVSTGPVLETPEETLRASFRCFAAASGASRPTLLLVHGTSLDSESNFSWNYIPALTQRGWPVCVVDLPNYGQDDIQASAEFVVHAIRETARANTGTIQIVGYSQGGMIPRWALRFWPDTRALVSEVIAIAGSNHGTVVANGACNPDCPESNWQQSFGSNFITALNRDYETFAQLDYTNIYTHNDEIVQPNLDDTGSTSLAGGANVTNVAVQDVCPGHFSDHLQLGSYDAVAYGLVLDALENGGPADPSRIALTVCAEPYMPGVNPATFSEDYGNMLAVIGDANANSGRATEEPPLRCYVQ